MPRQMTSAMTVFIASAGGLDPERDATETRARQAGEDFGVNRGIGVIVKRWEQRIGAAGNAQMQINSDVDEADIFIGIIGRRWGEPTGNGFDSGFEEEFERAAARWEKTRSPAIHLFFQVLDDDTVRDAGPQLRKVLQFRQRIEREHRAFHNPFINSVDLGIAVYRAVAIRLAPAPRGSDAPTESEAAVAPVEDQLEDHTSLLSPTAGRTLRVFADLFTTGTISSRLDIDRLELFALGISRDDDPLPTHLVNRLYLRADELDPMAVETSALLTAHLRDRGTTTEPAEWVIPFLAIPPTRAALTGELNQHAHLITSDEAAVVRGWLRTATRCGLRPALLWNDEDRSESGRAELERLWTQPAQPANRDTALLYWLQIADQADLGRARTLAQATDSDVSTLGQMLTELLDPHPSAVALAEHLPALLTQPAVVRLFPPGGPCHTLPTTTLADLTRRYRPTDLQIAALHELIARDEVPRTLITDLLTSDSDDINDSHAGWAGEARRLLLDRPVSTVFLTDFAGAFADLTIDQRRHARPIVARLLHANPGVAELLELVGVTTGTSPEDVAVNLELRRGSAAARTLALSLVNGSNDEVDAWILRLEGHGMTESTSLFVRGQFQMIGLEYLVSRDGGPVPVRVATVLRETAQGGSVRRRDAARLLVHVAGDGDVPFLVAGIWDTVSGDAPAALQHLIRRAGLQPLRALAVGGHQRAAAAAITELGRRGRPLSTRTLNELLHSDKQRVRTAALEQLADDLNEEQLTALLKDYTTRRPTYYYNVVCGLDARIAALRT